MHGAEQILDILSPHGNTGLKNAKVTGTISKQYDKQLKGYLYPLDASGGNRIQYPKDDKIGLSLLQPFLVLQVYIPTGKQFSFELSVTDTNKVRFLF